LESGLSSNIGACIICRVPGIVAAIFLCVGVGKKRERPGTTTDYQIALQSVISRCDTISTYRTLDLSLYSMNLFEHIIQSSLTLQKCQSRERGHGVCIKKTFSRLYVTTFECSHPSPG